MNADERRVMQRNAVVVVYVRRQGKHTRMYSLSAFLRAKSGYFLPTIAK